MKNMYHEPDMEIIKLDETSDVITKSGFNESINGSPDDNNSPWGDLGF